MRRSISLLVTGIFQRDVRTHASSIAFFFFMAFIPLLILLAAVVPFVGIKVSDVIGFFRELMPEGSAGLVSEMIREAFDHSTAALSISLLMLLWTASRGILALITGLNAMYHKKETRKSAKLTLLTIGYTIAFMAFISLVVYMIFSGRMTDLMKAAFPGMRAQPAMITFLEFLSLLIAGTVLFCLVYRYLPSGRRSLLRQLPGAFFTSAGWVLLSMGMRVYISLFNSFTRFYGSLAAVILLLFWFYWIFFLLLAGGYANAHMEQLLPARLLTLYAENKRISLAISGLFLLGFFSYLGESYLNRRLYILIHAGPLPVQLRIMTLLSWAAAAWIAVKKMKIPFPRKKGFALMVLIAGNLVLIRRSLIPGTLAYLVMLAFSNLVILLMCVSVLYSEEGYGKETEEEKNAYHRGKKSAEHGADGTFDDRCNQHCGQLGAGSAIDRYL